MFWLLLFIVSAFVLAYAGARMATTTAVFAAAILFHLVFGHSTPTSLLLALAWTVLLLPLNVEALRQEWFTRPLLSMFKRRMRMPDAAERLAQEVDSVGWEAELFKPRLDWERLRALSTPALSEEEQAFLDGPVETFCRLCDEWRITHRDGDLSDEAWTFLRRYRLLALHMPREFGGLEFSASACAAILAKIASSPGGIAAASILAYANAPGVAELLQHYGSDAQKLRHLPRLAAGDDIACLAPTDFWTDARHEGSGGAVACGIVVDVEWQGQRTLGVRLTIAQSAVALAPVASLVGIVFQLRDPEHRLGDTDEIGPCCALIPRDTPGLDIGRRHWPLDNPFAIGPIRADGLFIPLDWLIGGLSRAGEGAHMLGACLAAGRSLPLTAACAGNAVFAALAGGAYARLQDHHGRPLSEREAVGELLARSASHAYAADALRRAAAAALDRGEQSITAAVLVKTQTAALARSVVQDAMELRGYRGTLLGPSNTLGRRWQGAPVAIAAEGTNLDTRSRLAFARGVLRCHPCLSAEIKAAHDENPANAVEDFDTLLWPHIGRILGAAARALVMGLTGSLGATVPTGAARRHRQRASRYVAAFTLASEASLLLLGDELPQHESLGAQLGDVFALLYRACAVLRKWEDDDRPADDWPIVDWACLAIYQQIETALADALRRLPSQTLRWLLRILIFPLGRWARTPGSPLTSIVAARLSNPGSSRQRLTAVCFAPKTAGGPLNRLNAALDAWLAAEVLAQRCDAALREGRLPSGPPAQAVDAAVAGGILSEAEAQKLRRAQAMVAEVFAVDDFDIAELRRTPAA